MKISISGPHNLRLKDKKLFNQFLSLTTCPSSAYSFSNIFIWRKIFHISWYVIDKALCVFFQQSGCCFMYIEPLGKRITRKILLECFTIMNANNINKDFSRIENIPFEKRRIYEKLGFCWREQYPEYVYSRKEIAELKGNKYKSQRAAYNHFKKHYQFAYLPFISEDKRQCLNLLDEWSKYLKNKNSDEYFQALIDDSCKVQRFAFGRSQKLGIIGRMIKVEGRVVAYTFGYVLNKRVLCILFEVCDHAVKGVSKYIFSEFCREFPDFEYINVLDDSGIDSLRKAKLQFRPAFIIKMGSVFKIHP